MSIDNYPPGTWQGDPRAPWNQTDPPVCDCMMYAKQDAVDGTWNYCPWCGDPIDWNRWDDTNEVWR